jgi:hypothetical protein
LLVADYVEDGRGPPDPGELVECVPVNVEVAAETIEGSHYVTQARAAEELGVSRSRIGALLASGKLEGREFGGRRKVSLESVARYAVRSRAPTVPGSQNRRTCMNDFQNGRNCWLRGASWMIPVLLRTSSRAVYQGEYEVRYR